MVAFISCFSWVIAMALVLATPAYAQSLNETQMDLIAKYADRICGQASMKGEAQSSEMQGDLHAQLQGLAKNLLDVGGSGSGKVASSAYENVVREDLAANLHDVRACRLKMFDSLKAAAILPGPPTPRSDKSNSEPPVDVQPNFVAEAPGTYRGAIHGLVIFSDGSRQQLDMTATMTILAPVKRGGRFESSLTLPPRSMGTAPKTFFMQGTISGDRITFDDDQMRFVGRYNGRLISGNLSEKTKISDPPNMAERGIQRIQLVGMDLFKD